MSKMPVVLEGEDGQPVLEREAFQYFSLVRKLSEDPSVGFFPPFLPIEIALKTNSIREICKSHGISRERWEQLRENKAFLSAVKKAVDMTKQEGWTFKIKALMQSEALLNTSWTIIHSSDTPAAVKKDLILGTWKAAGVAETVEKANQGAVFNIQMNLG